MTKKEKALALARRARSAGKYALAGSKGSAMAAGSGAAAFYAAKIASEHVETLRSRWWATPAALAAAGHFAKKKSMALGAGLLGAAGWCAAQNYEANKAMVAATPAPAAAPQARGPEDYSWQDAARVVTPDAGAVADRGPADRGSPTDGAPYGDAGRVLDPADAAEPDDDYSSAMDLVA